MEEMFHVNDTAQQNGDGKPGTEGKETRKLQGGTWFKCWQRGVGGLTSGVRCWRLVHPIRLHLILG